MGLKELLNDFLVTNIYIIFDISYFSFNCEKCTTFLS